MPPDYTVLPDSWVVFSPLLSPFRYSDYYSSRCFKRFFSPDHESLETGSRRPLYPFKGTERLIIKTAACSVIRSSETQRKFRYSFKGLSIFVRAPSLSPSGSPRLRTDAHRILRCLVVDHAVKVVDRYQEQIVKFERDILIRPRVKTVRFRTSIVSS